MLVLKVLLLYKGKRYSAKEKYERVLLVPCQSIDGKGIGLPGWGVKSLFFKGLHPRFREDPFIERARKSDVPVPTGMRNKSSRGENSGDVSFRERCPYSLVPQGEEGRRALFHIAREKRKIARGEGTLFPCGSDVPSLERGVSL